MRTLFFLACVLSAAFAVGDIWANCGTSSDHLQIEQVTIIPDPPVIGQNVTITFVGYLNEEVTSGTVSLNLKWNGFTILNQSYSLCDLVKDYEKCPIPAGDISLTVTEYLPTAIPKGTYTGTVKAFDQNNQEIMCITLDLKFTSQLPTITIV
mmetsp:Transcript_11573/g.16083  ORF Transcript_11573/g.16083 Transcript_11573/m.16083 type:complete len:152 (+) Transcript_11573:45-500(+)|eukprot:CAMPEP_0168554730 /NCGR_PEP_ID=MMETSP0413-20121227/7940_1 /TAXON_ID=136452 /ORGANISM="Filamoeba nolandi, Strain NC-AS-23-1" /LENGTH=151 /DNA_ID=CAMNT_0008585499 /DNA_START=26 /DNA_END=481 /DNA_ORIENTATION=-